MNDTIVSSWTPPQCIARTASFFNEPIPSPTLAGAEETNCFRHTHLSPDGTTLITHNEDNILRTTILPPDLLRAQHTLEPYTSAPTTPITALAVHPSFTLSDPSTTLLLHTRPHQPLRLTNALDPSRTLASYALVNPNTEAHVTPSSVLFTSPTCFVAGTREGLACFDLHRHDGPVSWAPTRASRKARRAYGESAQGVGGLVSALAACAETGVLAAGSTAGDVGLYDALGRGAEVGTFATRGRGVTGLAWAEAGRYLLVAQRGCDVVEVWDVRSAGKLRDLAGRRAGTMQRLGMEVVRGEAGWDVWAGGTDGVVRIWRDVIGGEGYKVADEAWQAHGDAVSSVLVHQTGSVVITSSGSRRDLADAVGDGSEDDELEEGDERNEDEEPPGDRKLDSAGTDVSIKVWEL